MVPCTVMVSNCKHRTCVGMRLRGLLDGCRRCDRRLSTRPFVHHNQTSLSACQSTVQVQGSTWDKLVRKERRHRLSLEAAVLRSTAPSGGFVALYYISRLGVIHHRATLALSTSFDARHDEPGACTCRRGAPYLVTWHQRLLTSTSRRHAWQPARRSPRSRTCQSQRSARSAAVIRYDVTRPSRQSAVATAPELERA